MRTGGARQQQLATPCDCGAALEHIGADCCVTIEWNLDALTVVANGAHTHAPCPAPQSMPPTMNAWIAVLADSSRLQPAELAARFRTVLRPEWRSDFAVRKAIAKHRRSSSVQGSGGGAPLKTIEDFNDIRYRLAAMLGDTFIRDPFTIDLIYTQSSTQKELCAAVGVHNNAFGMQSELSCDDTFPLGNGEYMQFVVTGFSSTPGVGLVQLMSSALRGKDATTKQTVFRMFIIENPELVMIEEHALGGPMTTVTKGMRVVAPMKCFVKPDDWDAYAATYHIDPAAMHRIWWIGTVVKALKQSKGSRNGPNEVSVRWDHDDDMYAVVQAELKRATTHDEHDARSSRCGPCGWLLIDRQIVRSGTGAAVVHMEECLLLGVEYTQDDGGGGMKLRPMNDPTCAQAGHCVVCSAPCNTPGPQIFYGDVHDAMMNVRCCAACGGTSETRRTPLARLRASALIVDFDAAQLKGMIAGITEGIVAVVERTLHRIVRLAEKVSIEDSVARLVMSCVFHWRQAVVKKLRCTYAVCTQRREQRCL